jgi:predicted transcriptional regulator
MRWDASASCYFRILSLLSPRAVLGARVSGTCSSVLAVRYNSIAPAIIQVEYVYANKQDMRAKLHLIGIKLTPLVMTL